MKNKKNMKVITLFGLLVVGMLFGIQTASAGPLGGGDSFENAVQIYSEYSVEDLLDRGDEEYFYIMVDPGQTIILTATKIGSDYGHIKVFIYSEDKSIGLGSLDVRSGQEPGTGIILYSLNSEKDSYKLYIVMESVEYVTSHISLIVSVEDHYDAHGGTDAGDTFDGAMNIPSGSYEGFLSGYYGEGGSWGGLKLKDLGNDAKDFYKLSLKSGERINVALTPPDDVKLNLKIYNQDRAVVNSTQSPDKGVITRASWTAPSAQNIYILIERAGDYPSGTYRMDISGGLAPITSPSTPTPSPTPHTETTSGPTEKQKETCPFDCCISEPDYENKLCSSGHRCENNECVKDTETISDDSSQPSSKQCKENQVLFQGKCMEISEITDILKSDNITEKEIVKQEFIILPKEDKEKVLKYLEDKIEECIHKEEYEDCKIHASMLETLAFEANDENREEKAKAWVKECESEKKHKEFINLVLHILLAIVIAIPFAFIAHKFAERIKNSRIQWAITIVSFVISLIFIYLLMSHI